MPDYSRYQQKVIKNYYDNRDQIDEQRLSELVTNLYLSTGKKLAKHWETAESVMQRLNVPDSRIAHIMNKRDPAILAEVVEDLQKGPFPPKKKKSSGGSDAS